MKLHFVWNSADWKHTYVCMCKWLLCRLLTINFLIWFFEFDICTCGDQSVKSWLKSRNTRKIFCITSSTWFFWLIYCTKACFAPNELEHGWKIDQLHVYLSYSALLTCVTPVGTPVQHHTVVRSILNLTRKIWTKRDKPGRLTITIIKRVENGFYCVNNRINLKLFAFQKINIHRLLGVHVSWNICVNASICVCVRYVH